MSVLSRIEDALFLWWDGRREGALLSALVAVAATSRARFPDRTSIADGDAFEKFLVSAHPVRLSIEFRGSLHPIERIFFKWLRCELVHEGGLPVDVEFMPDAEPGTLVARAGGAPEFTLEISEGWFYHLVGMVVSAPENAALFTAWKA